MLGVLIGTEDGLLQVVPGEEPQRALEGLPVNSLDYREGVAVAGVAGRGVWVHLADDWRQLTRTRGEGWQQVWAGDPHCVRATPGGEVYIGARPPALFASIPGTMRSIELGALRGALEGEQRQAQADAVEQGHVAAIAFPDAGPEAALFLAVAGSGVWEAIDASSLTFERFEKRSQGLVPDLNGLWTHPERPERLFASSASGFYRSTDGGRNWVQSISGLDRSWAAGMAILAGTPDTLVLACARSAPDVTGALFRSANGGLSWRRLLLDGEDEWERAPLVTRLWDSEDTVFVAAGDKLWASHDAGRGWVALAEGLPAASALAAAL